MNRERSGNCLCGRVRYRITGDLFLERPRSDCRNRWTVPATRHKRKGLVLQIGFRLLCLFFTVPAVVESQESLNRAHSDFFPAADFGIYRYFGWEPSLMLDARVDSPVDLTALRRVRAAIERELTSKGFRRGDGTADFFVGATVGRRDTVDFFPYPHLRHANSAWDVRYFGVDADTNVYREGILAIDIYDRRLKAPVWHGWAEEPIDAAEAGGDSPIDRVVTAILEPFPERQLDWSAPLEIGFTYAEGYTSRTPELPIDLGFRAFTLYSTPCEGLPRTETVVAEPVRIALKPGDRFRMSDVVLRAYDETGQFTPRTPVYAMMHYMSDVLAFDSDNDKSFVAIAVGEGEGRALFRAGCRDGGELLLVEIPIVVSQ